MLSLLSLIKLDIRNNKRVQKQWIDQNEQNNWTDFSSKSSPVSCVHPSHCKLLSTALTVLELDYEGFIICLILRQIVCCVCMCTCRCKCGYTDVEATGRLNVILQLHLILGERVCPYIWRSAVRIGWLSLGVWLSLQPRDCRSAAGPGFLHRPCGSQPPSSLAHTVSWLELSVWHSPETFERLLIRRSPRLCGAAAMSVRSCLY